MAVPFVGRLFFREYIALTLSFLVLMLEFIVRIITLALPSPILNFCYNRSRAVFKLLPSTRRSRVAQKQHLPIVRQIRQANGFVEMCALFGYDAEEHVVQTKDGYLLGLHRIPRGRDEKAPKRGERERKKRGVVYLHHGLLMNSEVWVCNLEREKCLPFVLAEQGFDVWLGNNRGNKYSKKCIYHNSQDPAFWNFSMDEFAMHDIPDSIEYVLSTTKSKSLSYIGFSQGTAQAFATLSIHPDLNEVVDVFIALAPAMAPAGLYNTVVDALVKASPDVIFLFFGRKSILSSTMFWQSILYPPIFVQVIDMALKFLFNWTGRNISLQQKLAAYPHLYSFTSVKSVVHWFQIIRNRCFQMYDDDVQQPMGWGYGRSFYKVAKFPTRNIKTPISLVYGGSDSLVDISVMMAELPSHTEATEVPHYEHLDFLWGDEVDKLVIPHVLESLNNYSASATGEFNKEKRFGSKTSRFSQSKGSNEPPSYSEDERNGENGENGEGGSVSGNNVPQGSFPVNISQSKISRKLSSASFNSEGSSSSNDDKGPSTPSRKKKKSTTPSPPGSTGATPTGTRSPWPAWLLRRRNSDTSAVTSPAPSTGNPFFSAEGIKIGVGKPAQSTVSLNTLGEGEDFKEPQEPTAQKRKRKAASMQIMHASELSGITQS